MIYLLDDLISFTERDMNEALALLPEQRIEKYYRYRFFKDRRLSGIAYLLFMYGMINEGLGSYCKMPFIFGADGKPYLSELKTMDFNLSHCDEAVVCGISHNNNIGLDVQDFPAELNREVMDIVLSDKEISAVYADECPNQCFTRFWTLKESYYKCLGTGLVDEIKDLDFSEYQNNEFFMNEFIFRTQKFDTYFLSVCQEAATEFLPLIYVSADELKKMIRLYK